jgi:hypothetical protein
MSSVMACAAARELRDLSLRRPLSPPTKLQSAQGALGDRRWRMALVFREKAGVGVGHGGSERLLWPFITM